VCLVQAHELAPDDREVAIRLSTLYDARGLTYFDRGARRHVAP
jgi:hypothetical protein